MYGVSFGFNNKYLISRLIDFDCERVDLHDIQEETPPVL